jgi:hypothetical protein
MKPLTVWQKLWFILIYGVFSAPFIAIGLVLGVVIEAVQVGMHHSASYLRSHLGRTKSERAAKEKAGG